MPTPTDDTPLLQIAKMKNQLDFARKDAEQKRDNSSLHQAWNLRDDTQVEMEKSVETISELKTKLARKNIIAEFRFLLAILFLSLLFGMGYAELDRHATFEREKLEYLERKAQQNESFLFGIVEGYYKGSGDEEGLREFYRLQEEHQRREAALDD